MWTPTIMKTMGRLYKYSLHLLTSKAGVPRCASLADPLIEQYHSKQELQICLAQALSLRALIVLFSVLDSGD